MKNESTPIHHPLQLLHPVLCTFIMDAKLN